MALTKEEKKAKKEAKRLEKLKAEQEERKKLKREELKREMAMQALKRGEVDKNWRELMFKVKEPVFRQDIEVMRHTFERVYDKKDHLINYTIRLMKVADDQFQRTVASFCDTIDTMINKFLSDLEEMSKENNRKTGELLQRGEEDVVKIMKEHNTEETHLQLLLYHGYVTADSLVWAKRGENLVKEDEEKIKNSNYRENLRSLLENNYSALWDEYKAVLKTYVVDTASNQKQVRKLRRKDNLMADIIAAQGKKIANNDGMLKRLRTELASYESGSKQMAFRNRRNRYRSACFRLKQNFINGCTTDVQQMAMLVHSSNNAIEWLKQALTKANRILRMAALCRKFETRREKVLPFGSTMPHPPTQTNLSKQQSDDSLVVNALSCTCGLTRLWQRIAKAELIKRALLREKLLLQHENSLIIKNIQEYDEQKITPLTEACNCNIARKTKSLSRPTAIEGVLEFSKYVKH